MVSEAVGRLIHRRRKDELQISVEDLAERCREAGAPQLTVNALYVIESGRREKETGRRRRLITADELLALAVALRLNPVDLLVPPDLGDEDEYRLTPTMTTTAKKARDWIGGRGHLDVEPGDDLLRLATIIALLPDVRVEAIHGTDWLSNFDHDPRAHALLAAKLKAGANSAFTELWKKERERNA